MLFFFFDDILLKHTQPPNPHPPKKNKQRNKRGFKKVENYKIFYLISEKRNYIFEKGLIRAYSLEYLVHSSIEFDSVLHKEKFTGTILIVNTS